MNDFMHDVRWASRMVCATIRDEDGRALALWEKLWVAVLVILRIIEIEHRGK